MSAKATQTNTGEPHTEDTDKTLLHGVTMDAFKENVIPEMISAPDDVWYRGIGGKHGHQWYNGFKLKNVGSYLHEKDVTTLRELGWEVASAKVDENEHDVPMVTVTVRPIGSDDEIPSATGD